MRSSPSVKVGAALSAADAARVKVGRYAPADAARLHVA